MLPLCSRCGKVVILNVFKTGINTVLFLPVFKLCSWCFNSSVPTAAHGFLGHGPSLRLRFILENASLLAFYIVPPPTVPLH